MVFASERNVSKRRDLREILLQAMRTQGRRRFETCPPACCQSIGSAPCSRRSFA
jgi:hypothetical protein